MSKRNTVTFYYTTLNRYTKLSLRYHILYDNLILVLSSWHRASKTLGIFQVTGISLLFISPLGHPRVCANEMTQDGGWVPERPITGLEDWGFGPAHLRGLYKKAPINTVNTEAQWNFLIGKHINVSGGCPDSLERGHGSSVLWILPDLTLQVSSFGYT